MIQEIQEILKNPNFINTIIGIIVALLGVGGIFIGVQKHNKQTQKSGDNSTNIQANGNITIGGNINDK